MATLDLSAVRGGDHSQPRQYSIVEASVVRPSYPTTVAFQKFPSFSYSRRLSPNAVHDQLTQTCLVQLGSKTAILPSVCISDLYP